MHIGFVGLGKMGANMVKRLLKDKHSITVYDQNDEVAVELATQGATASGSIEELISELPSPKIVWIMVPAGDITKKVINEVASHLDPKDIIIDGGNSNFNDTMKLAAELREKKIHLIDSGTSGGIWGLKEGYCLMIGGDKEAFLEVEPIFMSLAPKDGYLHTGPSGSGHYVKMVHNGIEYALMESYAEGFEIMKNSNNFDLKLDEISEVWRHGSVVRSWLLDLLTDALKQEPDLNSILDHVSDSGEGRWTVNEAIQSSTPAPVIALSLMQRFRSRQDKSFSAKILSALRREFGGHPIETRKK